MSFRLGAVLGRPRNPACSAVSRVSLRSTQPTQSTPEWLQEQRIYREKHKVLEHDRALLISPIVVMLAMLSGLVPSPLWAKDKTTPVTLAEVRQEMLREQVSLSGTSVPWRRAMLSPRVNGLITRLKVDIGAWVEEGDEILVLDDRLARIDVRSAKAQVTEARARLQDARRIRDELMRLKKGRHTAQTTLDSAKAEVSTRQAVLEREQAALQRAEELLLRHRVVAPFTGMLVDKLVEVGQWVQRDDSVVELVSVETLRIRAPLPQRYYNKVSVGASVSVSFDALPGESFAGKVFARLARGDANTRSFPLLIDIPNPDHQLAPGMSARVRVLLDGETQSTLTVPRDAVITRADGSQRVWRVIEEDGVWTVQPSRVKTGRAQGDRLELLDTELKHGERIVLLGNENLRPGQRISAQNQPGLPSLTAGGE